MTKTYKHATSSVHLFSADNERPLIGLILHPRINKWMLPGGHVETYENEAEAAVREILEETGHAARLTNLYAPTPAQFRSRVPLPLFITEQEVQSDSSFNGPHIHVDHIYVAIAFQKVRDPELPFEWYDAEMLAELDMFGETRSAASDLFATLSNTDWLNMRAALD